MKKRPRMGGAAPPNDSDDDVVERGQQAWKFLKETGRTSWENWKLVGAALLVGRVHAMEVAKTKKPNGKRYAEAFNVWMQTRDFDVIDKSDRAKLLLIMEDLERIEKWLGKKTEAERASWNHPSTVWRVFHCKNRGIKAVNEKVEAPIPNARDLSPPADFAEDDEEFNWQRGPVLRIRKAIGDCKVPDHWALLEPPDRGLIALADELITAATTLRDYLQQLHDSTPEESVKVRKEYALEGAD